MRRILVPFKSLESVWILTRIVPILNESSQSILSLIEEAIEYLVSQTIYEWKYCVLFCLLPFLIRKIACRTQSFIPWISESFVTTCIYSQNDLTRVYSRQVHFELL